MRYALNHQVLTLFLVMGSMTSYGCSSIFSEPPPTHTFPIVNSAWIEHSVELKHSCFFGDLYGENELWLLSPYPFSETSHMSDLDGNAIHPQYEKGLVPAGTTFKVKRIEAPSRLALFRRMLWTPRFYTWVYLEQISTPPSLEHRERPFVIVLKGDYAESQELEMALNSWLDKNRTTSKWIANRSPMIQYGIRNKEAIEGMTLQELITAVGKPEKLVSQNTDSEMATVAHYPNQKYVFRSQKLVAIKPKS